MVNDTYGWNESIHTYGDLLDALRSTTQGNANGVLERLFDTLLTQDVNYSSPWRSLSMQQHVEKNVDVIRIHSKHAYRV